MTADTARVAAWLDAIEQAHAEAEWHAIKRSDNSLTTCRVTTDPTGEDNSQVVAVTSTTEQAAAIVAAHNNVPGLVAAVRGVLAYADLLSRTSGQRPEVVAIDAAHAIRAVVTAAVGESS